MTNVKGVLFGLYSGDKIDVTYDTIQLPEVFGTIEAAVSFFEHATNLHSRSQQKNTEVSDVWKDMIRTFWINQMQDWKNGVLSPQDAEHIANRILKGMYPSFVGKYLTVQPTVSSDNLAVNLSVNMALPSLNDSTIYKSVTIKVGLFKETMMDTFKLATTTKEKVAITQKLNDSSLKMTEETFVRLLRPSICQQNHTVGFGDLSARGFSFTELIHEAAIIEGDERYVTDRWGSYPTLIVPKYTIEENKVKLGMYAFDTFGGTLDCHKSGDLSTAASLSHRPKGLVQKKGEWKASSSSDVVLSLEQEEAIKILKDFLDDHNTNLIMKAHLAVFPCGEGLYILQEDHQFILLRMRENAVDWLGFLYSYDYFETKAKDLKNKLSVAEGIALERGLLAIKMSQ